ncbi:hypothetical protein [Gluconobacter morbifer]|uniref:hypothetical protein n=1 Tax=Gluconobacter morbifer TaxID=479935 RepID=UPI001C2FD6B5|nr:hypothetical protein [Gluconobacter morbifer]
MNLPRDRPSASAGPALFYARGAVMGPHDRAVDHIGRAIVANQFRQCLQQGIEHALLDPVAVTAKHAVSLAIAGRKMPPLRPRADHSHHAIEEPTVISSRTATAPRLRRQKRTDQRPFRIRRPDRLVQSHLQMAALNQSRAAPSSFVHER